MVSPVGSGLLVHNRLTHSLQVAQVARAIGESYGVAVIPTTTAATDEIVPEEGFVPLAEAPPAGSGSLFSGDIGSTFESRGIIQTQQHPSGELRMPTFFTRLRRLSQSSVLERSTSR